jgi:hypothetical protein
MDKSDTELIKLIPFLESLVHIVSTCMIREVAALNTMLRLPGYDEHLGSKVLDRTPQTYSPHKHTFWL